MSGKSTPSCGVVAVPSVTNGSRCGSGQVDLSASGSTGTYNWYAASSGGSILFTGSTYKTTFLSATTTFYVAAVDGGGCESNRVAVTATINSLPAKPSVVNLTQCSSNNYNLVAHGSPLDYRWYNTAVGGAIISTGSPFTTPLLSSTTVYYVSSVASNGCESGRVPAVVNILKTPVTETITPTTCGGSTGAISITVNRLQRILYPIDDANTEDDNMTTPYGSSQMMDVDPQASISTSPVPTTGKLGFLKFDLNSFPSGISFDSVKLNLTPYSITSYGGDQNTYVYQAANDSWDDNTITWNNQPSFTGGVLGSYNNVYPGGFTERTISTGYTTALRDAVNAEMSGDLFISFRIHSGGVKTLFRTKEYGDVSKTAQLVVNYIETCTYNWTGPGGFSSVTKNISGLAAGTYNLAVSNQYGCVTNYSFVVPSTLPAPTGTGNSRCDPGTVVLSASGSPGTYKWYSASTGGSSLASGASFTTPSLSTTTTYYVSAVNGSCESQVRTPVVATINPVPAAPSVTDGARCGTGTVTLSATGSPSDYRWYAASSGGTSIASGSSYTTPAITTTTTYYVSSMSAAGCESSTRTAVVATVNNIPTAPLGTDGARCGSGTVALSAAGAADYKWYAASSGGTSLASGSAYTTPVITTTTTYYVSSISAAGCESTVRTAVEAVVNAIPAAPAAVDGSLCGSGPVTIGATGSPSDYRWYAASSGGTPIVTGSSYTTPSISTTTTYYVSSLSAAGCESTTRTAVVATINPIPSAPVGTDAARCGTGTVTLNASGSPSSYRWYANSSGGAVLGTGSVYTTPSISATTTYYVSAVSAAGCESTTRTAVIATVNLIPSAPAGTDAARCGTGTVTLNASGSPLDYKWYDASSGGTLLGTGSVYTTPSISATTTYYASAVSAAGCESPTRTAVVATINAIPPAPAGTDAARCGTGTVTLNASGSPSSYRWYANSSGGAVLGTGSAYTTPSISATTTYYVSAVSAAGCESTTRTAVVATVNPIPSAPAGIDAARCGTGIVTLNASGSPLDYKWYDASSGGTLLGTGSVYTTPSISATTTYYASAVSAAGCESPTRTAVVATVNPIPSAPSGIDAARCGAGTVALNASGSPSGYRWYANSSGGAVLGTGASYTTPSISATTTYYASAVSAAGCESTTRTAVIATVNLIPSAPAGTDAARCGTGTVTLNASGSPLDYKWYDTSSGGTLLGTGSVYTTPSISATTTYYASAVSAAGCESTTRTAVVATVNPIPSAPSGIDAARCGAGTVTLNASGSPSDYKWYAGFSGGAVLGTGASYTTPSISATTTYYASAVSAAGCESTTRTAVIATVNLIPSAPAGTDAARCGTGTVTLNASGSPLDYKWYDASSGGTLLGTGSAYTTPSIGVTTTYYVSAISAASCESMIRTAVVATINPIPSAPSGTDNARCGSGTVTLNASGSPSGYRWYANSSGGSILATGAAYTTPSISTTTTYYVSAVSAAGCESTTRTAVIATVNPIPSAPVGINSTRCGTGTVTLGATGSPFDYKWYDAASGGTLLGTGSGYTTPSISATTTYYVTSVSAASCESTTRTAVIATVNPIPSAPTGTNASRCGTGTVILTSSGSPSDYKWYDVSSGGTLLGTGPSYTTPPLSTTTTYYVSAVSAASCESTTRTAVIVTINPIPSAPSGTDNARCGSGTVTLNASGSPAGYIWYANSAGGSVLATGATYTTPSISATTTYYVSAVSVAGCESTTRTAVVATINPIPSAPLVTGGASCGAGSVTLNASGSPSDYQWYDASSGGTLIGTGPNYVTPVLSATTTYYVTSYDGGCESTGRVPVVAVINPIPSVPTGSDEWRCGPGSVEISAGGAADYKWYDMASGGTLLGTGPDYTTPALSVTTTYYVSSVSAENCESPGRTSVIAFIYTIPAAPAVVEDYVCGSGTVTLTATGSSSDYRWYKANTGDVWLATGAVFTTPSISVTTTYYVSSVSPEGCVSDVRTPAIASVHPLPAAPAGTGGSVCTSGPVTLNASGSSSGYKWYDASSGGNLLTTGSSYTTPVVSASTDYYVAAIGSDGCEGSDRTAVTAHVDPPSDAGILDNDMVVDAGKNQGELILKNYVSTVVRWEYSTDGITFKTLNHTMDRYSFNDLTDTTRYRVVVRSGVCNETISNTVVVVTREFGNLNPDSMFVFRNIQNMASSFSLLDNDLITPGYRITEVNNKSTNNGGTISIDKLGYFTYTPRKNWGGKDTVIYSVCLYTDAGKGTCEFDTLYLTIGDSLMIYPTISPNGDGINDYWIIDGIENYPHNSVSIFNRWGDLVYEMKGSNNRDKLWKGESNVGIVIGGSELPEGTYFYHLDLGQGSRPLTGYIVLRR